MQDNSPIVTGTALALPEPTTLATLFRAENGLDPILAAIEAEARAHVPDLTSKKGRYAIASIAYKVSRSKTALDEAGKDVNEAARKEIALIDAARRAIRQRLDSLRDEVRKPLTEWEAAEEARVSRCKAVIASLNGHGMTGEDPSEDIKAKALEIKGVVIGPEFAEYREIAEKAQENALNGLRVIYQAAKSREDQAAELARLRAENERLERERAEREAAENAERERIATEQREAAEKAERDRLSAEAAERERIAAEERDAQIEREKREAADRAAAEAETRAKAEADRQKREAEERAEADRRAAAEREAELQRQIEEAKAQAEAAAQRERDRIEAERQAESDARQKREADDAHRAKIASDIADALRTMSGNATPENIAAALMDGKIPHCIVRL